MTELQIERVHKNGMDPKPQDINERERKGIEVGTKDLRVLVKKRWNNG